MLLAEGVKLYPEVMAVLESQTDFTGIVYPLAAYLLLAVIVQEEWARHIELIPTLSRHAGHLRTEHRRSTLTFPSRSCKIDLAMDQCQPQGFPPKELAFLLGVATLAVISMLGQKSGQFSFPGCALTL